MAKTAEEEYDILVRLNEAWHEGVEAGTQRVVWTSHGLDYPPAITSPYKKELEEWHNAHGSE